MSSDRSETDILRHYDRNFVWHPFTPMLEYCREEIPIIAEAEGFHLIDTEGRAYIDGTSSLWCNVHGHRVAEIDDAIAAQVDRVSHSTLLGLANAPSVELAHQLVARVPAGLSRVFYSDSGATAVEVALKIAFQFHRQKPRPESRDLFVSLSGAYHGDTLGAVSVGGVDLFHSVYESLLFPTLKVPSPVTYRVPPGYDADSYLQFCVDELDRTLRENQERIAAFIIEPLVQGASGMLVHPPGYLRRVRELTYQYDIPLIADEVAVGFGRTGTMFACEQEDVAPDILCLAKGLTGGYLPLAATLCSEEIYSAFLAPPEQYKTFFHGHTFTGNPLGCAAALASLRLFERNDILGNVQRNGAWLQERLDDWRRYPQVGDIRQCGVMVGIELVSDNESQARFPTAWRVGHRITKAARKRGLITRPLGDILVIMPAPAMPQRVLSELVDILEESMLDVLQHLPPDED
ncbi:MAG: adenosylmethionine--8-amino-7-oxononanoate transaminase [Planctomycetales bacterium]